MNQRALLWLPLFTHMQTICPAPVWEPVHCIRLRWCWLNHTGRWATRYIPITEHSSWASDLVTDNVIVLQKKILVVRPYYLWWVLWKWASWSQEMKVWEWVIVGRTISCIMGILLGMEKVAYNTAGDKTQCFFSQEITFYGTKPSLVAKGFQNPKTTGLIFLCRC